MVNELEMTVSRLRRTVRDFAHVCRADGAAGRDLVAMRDTLRTLRLEGPRDRLIESLRLWADDADGGAVLPLSFLFDVTKDPDYLERLLALLMDIGMTDQERYRLWLGVEYLLFMNRGAMPQARYEALRTGPVRQAYLDLECRLHSGTRAAPMEAASEPAGVAILTRIFRHHTQYAPGWDALELAHALRCRFDMRPYLVDCNLLDMPLRWPVWPPALFVPEGSGGWGRVAHRGHEYALFRCDWRHGEPGHFATAVAQVLGRRPALAIAYGDGNVVADAVAKAVPTYCIHYTADWPLTARARPCFHPSGSDQPVPGAIPITPAFTLPEDGAPVDRAMVGLPSEAVVIAVVGHRLHAEMTPRMLETLDAILAEAPEAVVWFIGFFDHGPAITAAYAGLGGRCYFSGVVDRLPQYLALADVLFCPDRGGGGTTAAFALAVGVPVVARRIGDTAVVVGEELTVDTPCQMIALGRRLATERAFRRERAAMGRARYGKINDRDATIRTILEDLSERDRPT